MGTKHLKFVSIPDAIEEIKTTLLMQSDFKKREELEPILRQLEDLQIRKDTIKVHPLDFVTRRKDHGMITGQQDGESNFCLLHAKPMILSEDYDH